MSEEARKEAVRLYKSGSYSLALEILLDEETDPAEDVELAYYMGLCYARLNEREDALRLLNQVLDSDTNLARLYQARMLIVWLLSEEGNWQEAEQNVREILQEGFISPQAWAALGYCQLCQDREDLAMESYSKAVDLDKENANAANGLGYLLAETGRNPGKAVELCRIAVDQNPENAAYNDSLGWALFRAGNIPEALRYLVEAKSLWPDDALIREHLEAVRVYGNS